MKYCENCGKEIAEGEMFCEKCGSKIEETTSSHMQNGQDKGKSVFSKIRHKNMPKSVGIILVVVAIVLIGHDAISGWQKADERYAETNAKSKKTEESNVDTEIGEEIAKTGLEESEVTPQIEESEVKSQIEEPEVVPQIEEESDIGSYVGSWQDSDNDVYRTGGALVEIYSIENDIMLFNVVQISANGNNIVETGDITAKVENSKVSFPYEDSRGNIGEGSLILGTDYISAILKDTHPNPSSTFSVEMNTYLYMDIDSPNGEQSYGNEGDYILANSSNEYLTRGEIIDLTEDELRKARNEIFARHGRLFTDVNLRTYFESKSWYVGTVDPTIFDQTLTNRLSSLEMANVELIKSEEEMR